MSILDRALQAFEDAEKREKNRILQAKRQKELDKYWGRYWECALVIWEITHANRDLLKIHPQKEPKWLKPTEHEINDLNKFEYVLYRTTANTPSSEGAVLRHEVSRIIKDYLVRCNFSVDDIKTEEDTYKYYLSVSVPDFRTGRTMSNKIGRLFVNRFYDAFNDLYYFAFDIRYFDNTTHGGIRDNAIISLYHEGQFLKAVTGRDMNNNPCLSRLPFKPNANYGYLVIV